MHKYEATIGIEVHVELKTNSKIFSSSANCYGTMANSCVNVIDLGYPGTLPTLNRAVVEAAIKAATIFHCDITKKMHFDRKNYFYPDNPKNYQITQQRTPIGRNGYIEIDTTEGQKKVYLEEMHIEEDTCKSMHKGDVSLLDFNRAGVPLIEIVTKPCMHTSQEAMQYLEKLKQLLYYSDISDCKMEEGSMRCDVNISVAKVGDPKLGTKIEVKNIGSIHNVGISIEEEIKRQTALLEKGITFKEETRRFDDKQNTTVLMRVKETGNDYRYYPEPDIPYLVISDEDIEKVKETIPMLPDERRKLYQERGISRQNADKLLQNRSLSDYLNQFLDTAIDFVIASNLLLGDIAAYLNRTMKLITDTCLSKEKFIELVTALKENTISHKNMKDILEDLLEKESSLKEVLQEKGIENISDTTLLIEIIQNIMKRNPQSIKDFQEGKDRAIKFLMGQVMKETKGSANPKVANELLLAELKKQ